jgi:hypothetical protein
MGTAQPPPPGPFPLPYADDFEKTALGHTPKYLSDHDGAFEVHPCVGRSGQCLEQVVSTKPIAWAATPDPFTLAGNSDWRDYTVAADVRFLSGGAATVMGRIDSADVFQDDKALLPSGYALSLTPDGHWALLTAGFKKPTMTLASGTATIGRNQWNHLELQFRGTRIEAILDGKALTSVNDSTHTHGMFALGSKWSRVQFDNLSVTP